MRSHRRHARPDKTPLSSSPFPRALAGLWKQRATGTLVLESQNLRKEIILMEGIPVHASSNIADESLGRFLLDRGVITEEVQFEALHKGISSGKKLGEMLVEMQAITPHELFVNLKRCFGKCILDTFRWTSGSFSFDHNPPDMDGIIALKVAPQLLIVRGVALNSPFEVIGEDLDADALLQLRPAAFEKAGLRLNGSEMRITRALKQPKSVAQLAGECSVSEEVAFRLVYALSVLELVASPEVIEQETTPPAALSAQSLSEPEPRDSAPQVQTLSEEDADAIDRAYLKAKSQNYFELLGAAPDTPVAELRRALLDRCNRFSPMSYKGVELGDRQERLEELFLAYTRAFHVLSNANSRAEYSRRVARAANATPSKAPPKREANPHGVNQAERDYRVHLKNGMAHLSSRNTARALEHFRAAHRVNDSDPMVLAYLGFCLFIVDNSEHEQAMHWVEASLKLAPRFAQAWYFRARMLEMGRDFKQALRCYEQCLHLDPRHKGALAAVGSLQRA